MEIKITLLPSGQAEVVYPTDKPVLTMAALKGAIKIVEQHAAQAEMEAGRLQIPAPDLQQRLLARRGSVGDMDRLTRS